MGKKRAYVSLWYKSRIGYSMDVRLNIRRLLVSLICTLILPMSIVIIADLHLGWFPWATIVATIIFFPLSTFVVIRATLTEMNQMIHELLPRESEAGTQLEHLNQINVK